MERLWLDDISVLYTNVSICPSMNSQSETEKYNCLVRFIIVYAFILSIYYKKTLPIQGAFIILGIIYILYHILYKNRAKAPLPPPCEWMTRMDANGEEPLVRNDEKDVEREDPSPAEIDKNFHTYGDADKVARTYPMVGSKPKECQKVTQSNPFGNPPSGSKNEYPTCPNQHKESDEFFFKGQPLNDLDVFTRGNSQRQFYTVPVTTDINQQSDFALWCYSSSTDRTHENTLVKLDK